MIVRKIVLDANILIRAVLGQNVRRILRKHQEKAGFYAAEACFREVHEHLPALLERRNELKTGLAILDQVLQIVQPVPRGAYERYEKAACERMVLRDPNDWPTVATAMLLHCPIWTEDQDFFGSGVAIWTTDRVELYLRESD
jgi:predicted nucleic acid-binding protein